MYLNILKQRFYFDEVESSAALLLLLYQKPSCMLSHESHLAVTLCPADPRHQATSLRVCSTDRGRKHLPLR